jgi:hypothetical protein
METAMPMRRPRSGNLTAALVAIALLELFVNRVFSRLFASGAALTSGVHGSRLIDYVGTFTFYVTAVLALGVFVVAFSGLVRRGELYPRAIRFSVVVIAIVFVGFSGRALVLGQMPPRHFIFLEIGLAFLSLLTVIALVTARVPTRVKVGFALFALPGMLHAFAIVASSHAAEGLGWGDAAVITAWGGEVALVIAGIAAPFTLSPRPFAERRWRLPAVVAATLTSALVVALAVRFDLVQASVLYGLRLDLPRLASWAGLAHVAAFFGWSFATTELIADKGGMRLVGYGLVLLALGGYEAGSPVELSLSLLGLIAVAVGELRAAPYADRTQARVPAAAWRAFVTRLVNAAGDATGPEDARPEAVWVEDGELEINRIATHRRGYPISIKLRRRRGTLVEMDATVGAASHGLPDASIERHRRWLARSPEHRLKLARLKTGDVVFDQKFSVHGDAPLGDEELRRRIARQQGDGVMTLWRGAAARYLISHPSADAEAPPVFGASVDGPEPVTFVVDLLDVLADLIEASLPDAS